MIDQATAANSGDRPAKKSRTSKKQEKAAAQTQPMALADATPAPSTASTAVTSSGGKVDLERLVLGIGNMVVSHCESTRQLDPRSKRKFILPEDHPLTPLMDGVVKLWKENKPVGKPHPHGGMWRSITVMLVQFTTQHWDQILERLQQRQRLVVEKQVMTDLCRELEKDGMVAAEMLTEVATFWRTKENGGLLQFVAKGELLRAPFPVGVESRDFLNMLLTGIEDHEVFGKAPKNNKQRQLEKMLADFAKSLKK